MDRGLGRSGFKVEDVLLSAVGLCLRRSRRSAALKS